MKKKKKISFKLFSECDFQMYINADLCFFPEEPTFNFPLEELKEKLKEEIKNLRNSLHKERSVEIYSEHINSINNHVSFFEVMPKLYVIEGFLYKELNKRLKYYEKEEFKKIQFYSI